MSKRLVYIILLLKQKEEIPPVFPHNKQIISLPTLALPKSGVRVEV
jgi:hypothetical protein